MAIERLKTTARMPKPISLPFRGGVRRSTACYRIRACLLRSFIYQSEVNGAWGESGVWRLWN
jgi:hypothetical protein